MAAACAPYSHAWTAWRRPDRNRGCEEPGASATASSPFASHLGTRAIKAIDPACAICDIQSARVSTTVSSGARSEAWPQ